MSAPWFQEYLNQTTSQYSLKLVDTPFRNKQHLYPKLLPLLRPLQYANTGIPQDAWVFLAISPKLFEDSLAESAAGHIYVTTREGDLIARQDPSNFSIEPLIQQLLSDDSFSGSFRKTVDGKECIVTYQKELYSGLLLFEVVPVDEIHVNHDVIRCEQTQRLAALPEHILCDGQIKRAVEQHLLAAQRHIMCDYTHLLIHACSFERVHAAGNAAVCHIDGRRRIV